MNTLDCPSISHQPLINLIQSHEEWLMERILEYAKRHHYVEYTSTLKEAWRVSICGLSDPLIKALQSHESMLDYGSQTNFEASEIAQFGVAEAEKHRSRGITLELFLGLMKYYRHAYLDLLNISQFSESAIAYYRQFILVFFDLIELGLTSTWCNLSETSKTHELQDENRQLTNQKNLYLTIFESSHDAIILLDEQGKLVNLNLTAAHWFSRLNVPGTLYYNPHSQQDSISLGWLDDQVAQMLQAGETSYRAELMLSTQNGDRWFDVRLQSMLDVSEKFNGIVATCTDITQQREVTATLRMLRQATEQSPASVVITDANGQIEYVNDKFEQVTGYTLAEVKGQNPRILKSGFTSGNEYTELWQQISQGKQWYGEFHNKKKTGELYWELASISPIRDESGEITHYLAVKEDITPRKLAESALRALTNELESRVAERTIELETANKQLVELNEALQQANRMKDEFLANMSHELRTPLNVILGMVEALLEGITGAMTPKQEEYLETVLQSGQHLLELINDLLDLAKIEIGVMELQMDAVSVNKLCQDCLPYLQLPAQKKNIQVNCHIPQSVGHIQADERRIRQVLINLLNNAVKFTPEGGTITLEVTTREEGSIIDLCVVDTGIGIPNEDISTIFQAFMQLHQGLSRAYDGSGLGLALVKHIVDLHGGSVSVNSVPGEGSRFTVSLLATMSQPQAPTQEPGDDRPTSNSSPGDSILVLIVEDNPGNVSTMELYLDAKGYRTSVAHNGVEALAKTLSDRPDLILMDIQMPEMDGLEAIRRIRLMETMGQVPIIALTALAMPGDQERCLNAGADAYVSKPASLRKLNQLIQTLIADRTLT